MKLPALTVLLVFAVAAPLAAAPLVACPDCGSDVSSRAVFCPHCGAPGEAIAEAAAAAAQPDDSADEAEVPAEPVPPPDAFLLARVNGRDTRALPVAFPDGPFALLPSSALDGLETLEFFFPSTSLPAAYGAPALSPGNLLVRFPLLGDLAALALHPLAANPGEGFAFDPAADPPGDAAPVAAVRIPGAEDVPLSDAIPWRTVSPKELKTLAHAKESP